MPFRYVSWCLNNSSHWRTGDKAVQAVDWVAIDWCLNISAKVLQFGFWPSKKADRGCCRTETWQAGDSISCRLREKDGVICIHQVTQVGPTTALKGCLWWNYHRKQTAMFQWTTVHINQQTLAMTIKIRNHETRRQQTTMTWLTVGTQNNRQPDCSFSS